MKPVNSDVSADTATGDDTAFDAADDSATDAVAGAATGTADGAASGTEERSDSATLGMILLAAEELWPASLAEEWDEVGLVAGHPSAAVTKILFAVDPTIEVIEEAIEWGAELVIAHHPLLLKGVTSVAANTAKGKAVHRLIESGTALLTVHTNGDSAVGGVSDVLADALGLQDVAPLTPAADGLPEEGIGRVGDLADVLTLGDFAARVFGILPSVAGGVRVAGDRDGLVRRVAVCGGAGDSLFAEVRASNADVYLTADLRHHPASEAREAAVNDRPYLIDVSHFASEWLWLPAAAEALGNVLSDQGHEVEIRVSTTNSDPWDFILTPGGD
jgi:dinuclear metal center YbgI/SA1388 family protein